MLKTVKRLMSTKSTVFLTRKIPINGFKLLKEQDLNIISWGKEEVMPQDEIIKVLEKNPEIEGILCMLTDKIDKKVLDYGKNLKCVSTFSVGYNHIDLQECKKRNIRVGYTPDVLTNATAELAVSLLLSTARRLPESSKAVKSGEWGDWKPEWMLGKEVSGSTVGVVGLGRIGKRFAEMLHNGFHCKILYSGPTDKKLNWAKFVSFDELLKESDFVCPHCSLNKNTTNLFNKDVFKKMKNDAIFINTTRGAVVNQDDLYEALTTGVIKAAGLDVTSPEPIDPKHKLLDLENCFILPHIGSATIGTRDKMSEISCKNLINGLKKDSKMVYEINL